MPPSSKRTHRQRSSSQEAWRITRIGSSWLTGELGNKRDEEREDRVGRKKRKRETRERRKVSKIISRAQCIHEC